MLQKYLITLITIFSLLLPHQVIAQEDWKITDFRSNITIQNDGKVKVEETIAVDFGNLEKHGIYRDLPTVYRSDDGTKYYTQIDVISVKRNGEPEKQQTSNNNSNLRIRVGDPNKTISGQQTYTIEYTASGVLQSLTDIDRFYWNVTGNDWQVPVEKASATVHLASGKITTVSCYQGGSGSTENCDNNLTSEQSANFTASRALAASEGLTILVSFPKDTFPILTVVPPKGLPQKIESNAFLWSLLVTSMIGLFLVLRQWYSKGRDPIGGETIIAEYDPPDSLRPAELGVLVDERADTLDVSATIVDLAVRGYLIIEEAKKKWFLGKNDYILHKTSKATSNLMTYESLLLNSLFESGSELALSDLKYKFYDDLAKVKSALYSEVTRKKLFDADPETVRVKYFAIAALIMLVAVAIVWLSFATSNTIILGIGAGAVVTAIAALGSAFYMPRRTSVGQELYQKTIGYRLFLNTVEKYRQRFFENQNLFMEVLPYAIVFGLTKKLALALAKLGLEPTQPAWYVSSGRFNPVVFVSSLDSFSTSLSSAIAATPSSGGSGGFSGGGFGGGGGGSW